MNWNLLLWISAGASIGAVVGHFNRYRKGTRPMKSVWQRGSLWGATLGLALYVAAGSAAKPYPEPKNLKVVDDTGFKSAVSTTTRPIVVDFFATWCSPCKELSPRLDRLAGEFSNQVEFLSVNVDDSPALSSQFNVEGIPTVVFLSRDGRVLDTSVGLASEEFLRSKIEALAKSTVD